MKKKQFLIGMFSLILALGILLAGCENPAGGGGGGGGFKNASLRYKVSATGGKLSNIEYSYTDENSITITSI
jgi:hypothetical protein